MPENAASFVERIDGDMVFAVPHCRSRVEALEQERHKLHLEVVAAQQDVVAQTCNLQADIAHLTGQLEQALGQASSREQQLRAVEAALAEQRATAEALSETTAGAGAAAAARLAVLEARCAAQQDELTVLRTRAESREAAMAAGAAEREAQQQAGAQQCVHAFRCSW